MRILILNQSFYPDVVSVAQHAADLAVFLTGEGHSVTVVTSRHAYTDPKVVFPRRETWRGCTIRRVGSLGLGKRGKWGRIVDSLSLLGAFLWEVARMPAFDVVLAMTHPPLIGAIAALLVRLKSGALVQWVMDLNPDEAIAAGWMREDSLPARALGATLRFALQSSARVVVLDRFMERRLTGKGVPAGRLAVIPPWTHDDSVAFNAGGRREFRRSLGIGDDRFLVMYSGNMSLVHPLDTLLEAMVRLRERPEIVFCFVGGGALLPQVRAMAERHALGNILYLPYQTRDRLSASLSAADLQVVTMGDAMVGIVHPCKIYNAMAVGVPLLHIGPASNHINDIIARLRTAGSAYSVRHGDVDGVVAAISDAARRRMAPVKELAETAAAFSQHSLIPLMAGVLESSLEAGEDRLPTLAAGARYGAGIEP